LAAAADVAVVVLEVPGARRATPPGASETVTVRQEGEAPDAFEVFPLGTCYARNRGAALTTVPTLTFVDSDGGFELTVPREAFLAAGGFDHALGLDTRRGGVHDWELAARLGLHVRRPPPREPVAAGRVARRRRDPVLALRAALRGGLDGVLGHSGWAAPPQALDLLPAELADAGPFSPLAAANPAKTHFLYRAGDDAVLHLHANPSERLRRSLAEREAIRAGAPEGAVPPLRATAESRDSLWVLEDRVEGEPLDPSALTPVVLDWAVELAGPPGPPLEASPEWTEHAQLLRGSVPPEALERVGRLSSRHMHGDLQPKNILARGGRLTAIDWEGAWREGIPGLDLVYLAFHAHGLDHAFLAALPAQVRSGLARLGVDEAVLPAALHVMLATWALGERRRRARLGAPPAPAFFEPALARFEPARTARRP
jgi:hypothetical protein